MNTKLNTSDFILLSIYFVVSFSIQTQQYIDRGALIREYLIDFPIEILCIASNIFFFVFWLIPKVLVNKKYIQFAFYALACMIVVEGIHYTLGFWSGANDWSKYPKGISFVLRMISRCSAEMAFPFALLLTKKFYEGKNELLKIKEQQKESELKLLRSQFDPHFLFNNLNTLDSLIDSDSKKAKEYINRLSLIYRYLIQTKDAEVMELADELEFAEHYIFLIDTRFGSDYEFSIDKNGTIRDKFIPTGALQAVLENVVKHNKIQKGLCVKTRIEIYDDNVTVSNLKSILNKNKDSLGTGLKNLKTRYSLLSENTLHIEETEDHYKISLPLLKLSNDL